MARNWGRMNSTVKTVWTTTIPYKTFVHVIVSSVCTSSHGTQPVRYRNHAEKQMDMHTMYKCTSLRGPKLVHTSYGILRLLVSVAIQKKSSTAATKIIFQTIQNLPLLLTSMAPSCTTDKCCDKDDDLSPSCCNGETEEPGTESTDGR